MMMGNIEFSICYNLIEREIKREKNEEKKMIADKGR